MEVREASLVVTVENGNVRFSIRDVDTDAEEAAMCLPRDRVEALSEFLLRFLGEAK
jgi:hypothetical protein